MVVREEDEVITNMKVRSRDVLPFCMILEMSKGYIS